MAPSHFSSSMSPISPLLALRDIPGDINGVKTTFSSWDNCMAKDYCKWPVITAIIIASLIAASILLCIVRCCCCGMECCCAACSCMNACCPSPRGGRRDKTKFRDAAPPSHLGYQPTPGPFYGAPSVPQFATFDASKKVHADALPAMPSWDTATSKKVVDDSQPEEVEMDKMDQHDERKPMLANGASPQVGGMGYDPHGTTPYSDGAGAVGTAYGHDNYQQQHLGVIDTAAAGALNSQHEAGSAQGYRGPNGQRPGMGPSQDSYNSQMTNNQGFQTQRPGMGSPPNSYSNQEYQNSSQQGFGAVGYRQNQPSSYNQTGNHGGNGHFAPAHGQSFGSAVSPPQPTYTGQQEYTRSAGQTPSSLAPGYRGAAYAGSAQQFYQPYQGNQRSDQSQWRDV